MITRVLPTGALALLVALVAVPAAAQRPQTPRPPDEGPPPLLMPGAPGKDTRAITATAATDLSQVGFTPADVAFMQGMIGHHRQALEMAALLPDRTSREDMKLLAKRIEVSQADEIEMMKEWLTSRGQSLPDEHAHHEHGGLMPGMLTPDDMMKLGLATGVDFDRMFLEGMIRHHGGALTMVKDLFASPRAGQDSDIFAFASDVEADQQMEIERMSALLKELRK